MPFSSNKILNISSNFSILTTNTTVKPATDILIITQILSVTDRYIEIILYILGVCGALLNIFTFLQKQLRTNPCSMYFLAASFCDLCTCNVFILIRIVSLFSTQGYLQFSHTSFWCKFSNYCVFMFPCLSSLYITFASIDRFCTSSRQVKLRRFSSVKVSRIVTPCLFLIWGLFSMHIPIAYNLRKATSNTTALICMPPQDIYTFFVIIDGFFFALFNGAIVPFFLALFGILIIRHVRRTRRRTAAAVPVVPARPTEPGSVSAITNGGSITLISRANLHLITMLLVQVFLTIFLNLPYVIIYLNNLYHPVELTPFYRTVAYIATWFYYMNYCKTFYVNTLSSQFYRSILKQQVLHILRRSRTQLQLVTG